MANYPTISPESIASWSNLLDDWRTRSAARPYIKDNARISHDTSLAKLLMKQAEANAAPKYYNSRADLTANQANYERTKAKYAPQDFQADLDYKRANTNSINQKSQLATLLGSGKAQMILDPATNQYVVAPTRASITKDLKTLAGGQNLNQYLDKAIEKLPQFQTGTAQALTGLQGLSNYLFHTNFKGPSEKVSGEAAINSAAEGFLNEFGLNITDKNIQAAKDIFRPHFGESAQTYRSRISGQLVELNDVLRRAQERLSGPIPTGVTPDQRQAAMQDAVVPPMMPHPVQPQNNAPEMALDQNQIAKLQKFQAMAQEAIKNGADPKAVEERMKQLMGDS